MVIQHTRRPQLLFVPVAALIVGIIFVMGGTTSRALAWMGPDDWGPGVSNTFETGCCSSSDSSFTQGVTGVSQGETPGYWNQNCCGSEVSGYESGVFQIGWEHGVADAHMTTFTTWYTITTAGDVAILLYMKKASTKDMTRNGIFTKILNNSKNTTNCQQLYFNQWR